MKRLTLEIILTACFIVPIYGIPKPGGNATLPNHGSHYLFKLDNIEKDAEGGGKRNSRCTPCGHDTGDRREVTNYLDPEYRGNGADNLGYDWSPWAWGGPAFANRMKNYGRQYDGWDRGRGGRQMPGNWSPRPDNADHFNCDRCRMIWERARGSGTNDNGFANRMGRWQGGFQGEVATVTSPPIALRPESRIAYVPSPGGEMYWDGVSGGGTRWDGFSNGISWLGGRDGWRDDPRNRGYDPKRPDNPSGGYHRPWSGEPNRYYPGKGYGDRGPNMDHGMRYNGYASQWHYGTTNQNGWNGNNMKWSYGGGGRDGHGYYGGGSPGGKFDEEGNPLPQGHGGSHPYGGSRPYGQGAPGPYGQGGSHPHGLGGSYPYGGSVGSYGQGGSNPYAPGTIQYGQGGSIYYDQGNYIFHYGQGGSGGYDPSKYPQDGKPSSYPVGRPDQTPYPGTSRPSAKPWDYNSNDRFDNAGYPNINWVRPEPGYPKPSSHGKYPSGGYDDKNDRKPWSQRPTTGGYGPGRPDPGFPHGGSGYITGGVSHGGGSSRPGGYPGGGEFPGGHHKPGGYPPGGGSGYPSSGGYPVSGGSRYPGGSSGYPSHPAPGGGPGYGGSSGSHGYPGPIGGSGYPSEGGHSGYPGPGGSSGHLKPIGGSGYPGSSGSGHHPHPHGGGGSGYPTSGGGPSYPSPGGSGYHGSSGGSGYPDQRPGPTGGYPDHRPGSYPDQRPGGYPEQRPGPGGGYPDHRPGPTGGYPNHAFRPGDSGGYGRPGPERPGGYGNGPSPPKGYYTGFITEIDPNKYPNNVNIGSGGNRYPAGGGYPTSDKDPGYGEGQWYGNKYPGGGDRYPGGDGYPFGGNRYPDDHYRPGSQDRFSSNGDLDKGPSVGDENNSWNYGQDGHKDGIYRRAGGSYPPYRGGPYYTSSYLASASTPAGVSQPPSEGKTQSVTAADAVTKPTPEST